MKEKATDRFLVQLDDFLKKQKEIFFFHYINYKSIQSIENVILDYEHSGYWVRDKNIAINTWLRGLSLIWSDNSDLKRIAKGDKIKLTKYIYEELPIKYNLHIKVNRSDEKNSLKISSNENNIFVECQLNRVLNISLPRINDLHTIFKKDEKVLSDFFSYVSAKTINDVDSSFLLNDINILISKFDKNKLIDLFSDPSYLNKLLDIIKIVILFLSPSANNETKVFSCIIPAIYRNPKNDNEISGSGLVILANDFLKDNIIQNIDLLVYKLAAKKTLEFLNAASRKSAIKSAISQVMARNMSHNIGSHVLSKLITNDQIRRLHFLDKESNKIHFDRQVIDFNEWNFYQCKNQIEGIDYKKVNGKKEVLLDEDRSHLLVANFNNYIKARMDYLADITTNTPVMENPKGIYNDIIKPFIQTRLLNDRISGIDNFNYKILVCKPNQNTNGKECHNVETDECQCKVDENKDIILSIPNDILGCHAFYTILENIIRNTAKHGTTPKSGVKEIPVEFKIKIEEASSLSIATDRKGNVDLNEYYAISIFDNCEIKDLPDLVASQNTRINDSILDRNENQLRHGAWGVIEMAASAAYLRKVDIELIDSEQYKIDGSSIITNDGELTIFQAYQEQHQYLGYRFFIRKPQEILIIANDKDITLNENLKTKVGNKESFSQTLKNNGIWIIGKNEEDKIYPHQLVIVIDNNDVLLNTLKDNPCFSRRIFRKDELELDSERPDKLKLKLWKEYYKDIQAKSYNGDDLVPFISNGLECTDDLHGKGYCGHYDTKNKYIELSTSATKHYLYSESEKKDKIHLYKEIASKPINIIVFDERIQEFAKNRYSIEKEKGENYPCNVKECFHNDGIPYEVIYQRTNIKVPDASVDCNLNAQNFHTINKEETFEYNRIIDCFQNFIIGNSDNKHFFIIIHLGIIEKLLNAHKDLNKTKEYDKEDKESIRDFVFDILLNKNGQYYKEKDDYSNFYDHIVVTSGRGTPQNIPQGIRYLNFSVISQYLITLRNKYALTESLFSARKTN